MTDEAWIEQSLARLETLEAEKAQLEGAGQAIPAQLDEEIATLYEALETAAGGEEDAAAAEAPAVAAAAAPAPAPAPASSLPDDPFAAAPAPGPAPAPASDGPMMVAPTSAPMDYDDDIAPSGGKGGLVAVAVVAVLGLGAGGWWFMTQNKEEPQAAPAPAGDPKVISASSVPEDTQEPQAAKGANAERTQGTRYKAGPAATPSNSGAKRPSGNRPKNRKKKDDGRKVNVTDSRDPLAGI